MTCTEERIESRRRSSDARWLRVMDLLDRQKDRWAGAQGRAFEIQHARRCKLLDAATRALAETAVLEEVTHGY